MSRKRSRNRRRHKTEPTRPTSHRRLWVAVGVAIVVVICAASAIQWRRTHHAPLSKSVVSDQVAEADTEASSPANLPETAFEGSRDDKTASSLNDRKPGTDSSDSDVAKPARAVTPRVEAKQARQNEQLDPAHDGWQTEQFAELAHQQLQQLVQYVGRPAQLPSTLMAKILDRQFACAPLRPPNLQRVYRDDMVVIRRATDASLRSAAGYRGARGLIASLQTLEVALGKSASVNSLIKVYQIKRQDNLLAAKVRIELNSVPPRHRGQIRADWDCLWSVRDDRLSLSTIRVARYEEAVARYPDEDWFTDCTSSVLGRNTSYDDQLRFGLDHWLTRIERVHRMHVFMATGIAVGDANGDELDDLFVCQAGGLPNRLYLQNLDGTATDVSMRARVDWLDSTSSALFLDLDNDGDQDLVLATLSGLMVLENNGAAQFNLVGTLPTGGADMQSMCAADYDNDGDLDIYVCLNFPKVTRDADEYDREFIYHNANDGAPNHLFRNNQVPNGTWNFTDVTKSSGLTDNNSRHSLAAAWEDYDNDGDQDLYVANDYGQNSLYRNDEGRFSDVAEKIGVTDSGSGMSVSWGDYNRDGWMDLYVGNMFSSAGSRITTQQQFRPGIDDATRSILRRFAKGNSLFVNDGKGGFRDVGAGAGVEIARWAWSSLFLDLNNSGWEDIVVANGYITTEDTGDL